MLCKKCRKDIPDGSAFCNWCGVSQAPKKKPVKRKGNGQGTVYQLPNGKWRADVVLGYYTGADGKRHTRRATRTCIKKSDAIAAVVVLKAQPAYVKDTSLTLSDLNEIYTSSKDYDKLSDSQRNKLKYAWARLEPIAHRKITELTVDELQTTIDGAVSTYYPARDMKVMISHLYAIALRKEIVTVNKSEYIDLPDAPNVKKERWEDEDLRAFWYDYKTHPFTGYILIMIYCGLRYGELAKLEIENINLEKQVMIGGIKTEAGIDREIPIANNVLPIISHFVSQGKYKLLEMNEDNFYARYWATIERLGLRHLPPQTGRHTYFSLMTAAGIQAGIITETGGHASYSTTVKNYVKLNLAEKLDAVNRICYNLSEQIVKQA